MASTQSISVTDYISTVSSVIAAVFGLVTVVTVVVAARQLLTEHRAYASGLSQQALGPWHDKVRTRRLLGLQQDIHTPTITVPSLLKANWNPQFVFPGTPASTPQDGKAEDPEKALAKASWVNFLAAIGIEPNDQNLYQMSAQPNLVNGIVPMRWEGKSLVAICSLLGFQSFEKKPSSREPMKLPMHWAGPLGWLQFREGRDGCIVEYRRRSVIADQIDPEVHVFFKPASQDADSHNFVARLWRSMNVMIIGGKKALYLGGTDDREERRAKRRAAGENLEKTGSDDSSPDFDALMKGKSGTPTETSNLSTASTTVAAPQTLTKRREDDDLFEDLIKTASKEDIMKKLRNTNYRRGKDESDWETELDAGLSDILRRMREKRLGKMEVFMPCEGLLSVVFEGELAGSRGLSIRDCTEYSRAYVDDDDVDQKRTPYRLGDLFMDEGLLKRMKEAVGFIKPDGFYFTPTRWFASDVDEVYGHVDRVCESPKNGEAVFPKLKLEDWPTTCKEYKCLHYTMVLCNNLQHIRLHGSAQFTIGDMVVMRKASASLPKVADLVWSMLISPDLFKDLNRAFNRSSEKFKADGGWDFLYAKVSCSGGVLNCTDLMRSCGLSRDDGIKYATAASTPAAETDPMDYTVPLCSDGTFQGSQVLASFLDVLVTHFWLEESCWVTDVEPYDHVIPQTITMC